MTPDGSRMLQKDVDEELHEVWDIASPDPTEWKCLQILRGGDDVATLSPDGCFLVTATRDRPWDFTIYHLMTRKVVRTFVDEEKLMMSDSSLVFSRDCSIVYDMHSQGMTGWDVSTGNRISTIRGIDVWGSRTFLSPSGRYVAATLFLLLDGSCHSALIDVSDGAEIIKNQPTPTAQWCSGWFPDEQHLISNQELGHIVQFVSKSDLAVARMVSLSRDRQRIVDMSSDGRLIVMAVSNDRASTMTLEVSCASGGRWDFTDD